MSLTPASLETPRPLSGPLQGLDFSILQQCMHCGMCLPECPTYGETLRERHSPRGRISLMRAVAEGELAADAAFAEEMAYCIGCLACTSACPAGVDYATLLEAARAQAEAAPLVRAPRRGFYRWLTLRVLFRRPGLLRVAGRVLAFWQRSGLEGIARRWGLLRVLPAELRRAEPLAPRLAREFTHDWVGEVTPPAPGVARRGRVAVLSGCVQDLVFGRINRDTVEVLAANGFEVHVPRGQPCCGSLHAHNGDPQSAHELARRLMAQVPPERFDFIVSNAGGCGSHLRRYSQLCAGDPEWDPVARAWDAKVRDIHELLAEVGWRQPPVAPPGWEGRRVAYHDACHLAHGQGVRAAPRAILDGLPGIQRVNLPEADWCCGSAGIYTLTQPESSARLLERKVGQVAPLAVDAVVLANPGCHLQVERGLAADPRTAAVRVVQPVELLAAAYRAERAQP